LWIRGNAQTATSHIFFYSAQRDSKTMVKREQSLEWYEYECAVPLKPLKKENHYSASISIYPERN